MDIAGQVNQALSKQLPGYLGITVESASPQEITGSLTVEEHHCTTGGILHGGAIMALADTLGAIGAFLNLPPNSRTTTVESKTNFLRPAKIGDRVTARCKLVNKGKTLVLWLTEVSNAEGKLLALVSQSQIVIRGAK